MKRSKVVLAVGGAMLALVVIGAFAAKGWWLKKAQQIETAYAPLFEYTSDDVGWTSLGRYWWKQRSQNNAIRADYFAGRVLPAWGYLREVRVLPTLVAAYFWDPDD